MRRKEHQNYPKAPRGWRNFVASRRWRGYTIAAVGTALAVLVRWLLQRAVTGELQAFTTFYPVVFLAAVLGGTGPGLLATVLGALAADFFFIPPVAAFGFETPAQAISFTLFILVNLVVSHFGGRFYKKSEALQASDARQRLSNQVAHIGSFELNLQTGVNFWTPQLEMMYGLKVRQFPGTQPAWEALVHPEDRPRAIAAVDRALQTFQPEESEWRVVWPDGSVHWLVGRFQAFPDNTGKPLRLVGVNVDITDRKNAADALQQSEERFRAWISGGSYAEFRMSPDWTELREIHGHQFVADTEVPTRTWLDTYIPPEEHARVRAAIDQAICTKSPVEIEHRVRRADGSIGWSLSRTIPILDANGNITGWFGAAHDITQRKQAEEALQKSEAWFRTMADSIPQLAWIARADGYIMWFNRRCYEYTGAGPEQLEGWAWQSFIEPHALPNALDRWNRSIATGEPYDDLEFPMRGRDGRYRPFLAIVSPLKDDQGRVSLWFGTATDISEIRDRERALARQARMIDLAPAATMVLRLDGTITFWSHGAERFYGWTQQEALGARAMDLLHTEFPEPFEGIVAKLRGGGTWSGELKQYTRSGRQVVVESFWLAELNQQGQVDDLLESNTDITQRKCLQEHLQEEVDARIAELEHMSYSMIHDMRAPLRGMQSFAHILEEDCPDCRHPPGSEYLAAIRRSSIRLDSLVTDALNYNRLIREVAPIAPVEIGPLLRSIIDSYPDLQPQRADIVVDVDDITVLGNESLLTQCFGNLLDNAVKFVAPGVRSSVRVWAEETEETNPPEKAEGHSPAIRIWFEDNGLGIREDAQEKIFQMFQRMYREEEYPGTGMGLTIVKKAVERMNGSVGIESEPGKGSKFWIELPRAARHEPRERLQPANNV